MLAKNRAALALAFVHFLTAVDNHVNDKKEYSIKEIEKILNPAVVAARLWALTLLSSQENLEGRIDQRYALLLEVLTGWIKFKLPRSAWESFDEKVEKIEEKIGAFRSGKVEEKKEIEAFFTGTLGWAFWGFYTTGHKVQPLPLEELTTVFLESKIQLLEEKLSKAIPEV